ncbi:thioredoxin-disulfide reductase [Roseixanthobacter liquoris]|uniref:thioredoxin-disulfide reductase n=1 Tax=Roseixanthobacter liquoris TaxID=3119921 RepID=UPI003728EFDB
MSSLSARLVILGSGPAGWTAAVYAARALMQPIVITGMQPGGQLTTTTDVENYPGFVEPIEGPWLMEQMRGQAERFGTRIIEDHISAVDLAATPFRLTGDSGTIYTADALIIATGAQARWLGLPGEERLKGFGVSACATCDGFFFRGKHVVVVGGGNTAVEEALYLSHLAAKVTAVHRRDSFRAEKIMQDRLFAAPNVDVVWNAVVEDILGEGEVPKVEGVRLRDVTSGAVRDLACDGVFVAIGHAPATELFRDKLELDAAGYLVVRSGSTRTSVPGVFAAGDVADSVYRQAVTAAGMGCMAALDAERWLAGQRPARLAAE